MVNTDEHQYTHIPVLATHILEQLIPASGSCRMIDGTLGYAGHSSLALEKNSELELLGIDRDDMALRSAKERLSQYGNRVHLTRDTFSNLKECAEELHWDSVDIILLDIGVSSPQIDNPERGFSFRLDGPLDMRMDRRSTTTASRILNNADPELLVTIFKSGDVKSARRLVNKIVEVRNETPITTTLQFASICEAVLGKSRPGKLPTPTLCFQALRIAVNSELDELKKGLADGIKLLAPGGRIGVISFHSLEDKIVKQTFRQHATECICPPGMPICVCEHKADLKIITKRPLIATDDEIKQNSRAACAKLRIAEKL